MVKKEISRAQATAYHRASKKRKGQILDLLCETIGWSRDNARRQLRNAYKRRFQAPPKKKPPRYKYPPVARQVLLNLWAITGQCCGLYLYGQIQEGVLERLLSHKALRYGQKNHGPAVKPGDPVLDALKAMSSATLDRHLSAAKRALQPLAVSSTKQASYPLRNVEPL